MKAGVLTTAVGVLALGCARMGASSLAPPRALPRSDADGLQWVGADTARATALGAGPPLVVATGVGAAGDTVGGRIEVPADDCVLVLAHGSPSVEDLDVFVYGDDGAVLGADDKPNVAGAVIVCPPHPRHIYAFGRLAAGHGLLAVSAQLVRRADAARTAQAVGAKVDSPTGPIGAQGWPGLDEAIRAHRHTLGAEFRDVRRLAAPLDARIGTRISMAPDADECLDVFVLPSDDVAFVELTVLDGTGRIVARAPNESRTPSLVLCVPAHTDLTIELRPHAGQGLAAVIIGANDDSKARRTIGGEQGAVDLFPTASLSDIRKSVNDRLVRLGYPHAVTILQGSSEVGVRKGIPVNIPDGCSRLDVLAGSPTRSVDAWLWSSSGALIAHDGSTSGSELYACGGAPGARLDVETLAHGGPFAVELRNIRGVSPLLSNLPLAAGRLLGRLSAADRLVTPKEAGGLKRLRLDSTTLTKEVAEVTAGACLDVCLALDTGAEGAELRIMDAVEGTELAVARGTYSALAETCALDRAKALPIRIEMHAGAGAADALFTMLPRPMTGVR